jgi:hypothetical protein
MLNREKQEIIKYISIKKLKYMHTPLCLFLIGGAGTGKIFTTKMILQIIIQIHDANNTTNLLKPKGLIRVYKGKAA